MSQGRGSIPERIRRALYVLSRGRCYAPNCDEPVLVIDRDEVVFVGNVAHIVAASSDGPRGTSRPMNTEAFANLLVLCGRHHAIVDDAQTRGHYPPTELRKWKRARESEFDEQTLAELHRIRVSETELKTMIVQSFKETTAELTTAIGRLEQAGAIAHGAAELLRDSASALPEIDDSAQLLMLFADVMPYFDRSAQHLASFINVVPYFDRSASSLAEHAMTLSRFSDSLDRIANQGEVQRLEDVAQRLESAVDQAAQLRVPAIEPRRPVPVMSVSSSLTPDNERDLLFVAKVAGVALATGLLVGVAATGWAWWHHASTAAQDRQACTGPSRPADFTVKRQVKVKVSGTPTQSPSPYVCAAWYSDPIPRPAKR